PGTLTSMDPATDWVMTEKGWALDFDGSDYVPIPNCDLSGPITVSMWFKPRSLAGNSGWFCRTKKDTPYIQWGFKCQSGNFAMMRPSAYVYPAANPSLNEWHHAFGVSRAGRHVCYIDGVPGTVDTSATEIVGDPTQSTNIGRYEYGPSYANGVIGMCAVWNADMEWALPHLARDPHAIPRLAAVPYPLTAAPPGFAGRNRIIGGGLVAA
ncbi:MAG TPA: LamG domain-containing protein, partial [Thermoguttaceae bacterium]|nr:LamG domain-containing protein [Thermoguttaceae bacterium]